MKSRPDGGVGEGQDVEGEVEPRGLPFDWHRPGKVYGPSSSLVKGASSVRVWQDLQPPPSSLPHLLPDSAFQCVAPLIPREMPALVASDVSLGLGRAG